MPSEREKQKGPDTGKTGEKNGNHSFPQRNSFWARAQ